MTDAVKSLHKVQDRTNTEAFLHVFWSLVNNGDQLCDGGTLRKKTELMWRDDVVVCQKAEQPFANQGIENLANSMQECYFNW